MSINHQKKLHKPAKQWLMSYFLKTARDYSLVAIRDYSPFVIRIFRAPLLHLYTYLYATLIYKTIEILRALSLGMTHGLEFYRLPSCLDDTVCYNVYVLTRVPTNSVKRNDYIAKSEIGQKVSK